MLCRLDHCSHYGFANEAPWAHQLQNFRDPVRCLCVLMNNISCAVINLELHSFFFIRTFFIRTLRLRLTQILRTY